MDSQQLMQFRNKMVAFFVMPVAVVLWLIGWSLTYFGSKQIPAQVKAPTQENIVFTVSTSELQIPNQELQINA